ncbi:MAG: ABC transporter permease [Opitutae bacterium]|nr:ABC transporter permease [Opitutae bacterium]
MKLRRRLSSSLRPLLAHRTRALLALAGVAVGTAAVIVSRALGAGAQEEMRRTIERTGTNLLLVKPLPVKRLAARPQIRGFASTLVVEDADAIARLDQVATVAPAIERPGRVKFAGAVMRTTIRGTTPAFPTVRSFALAGGRFFNASDERQARRVAVLGARVADELSAGRSPVGATVRIGGIPFEVIGVFAARGTTTDGADQDNQIVVPLPTALRRVFNATGLTNIYIGVTQPERMDEAESGILHLLRARHRRGAGETPDDFAIQNTAKSRSFQQEMIASLSRYATGLASLALGMGGIGILALMLLSVRERTSEIGLRLAVGAQPRDILIQFLGEAAALALGGWALGALVAGAAVTALALWTNWTVGVPTMTIAASFGMTFIVGLGFGALPARNAARVPPIAALTTR